MTARTHTLWTFVITSIALLMVTVDNLVVTMALPVIRQDLGASLEGLEWTVNGCTLTFAVLLLTGAAGGAGARRRARHAAHAHASERGRSPGEARARARRLGRHRRSRRGPRAARRRRRRRGVSWQWIFLVDGPLRLAV